MGQQGEIYEKTPVYNFTYLLFFTGLSVLLYPTVSNYVNGKNQSKAIASYVESMEQMDASTYEELLTEAKAYNEQLLSKQARFAMEGEALEQYLQLLHSDGGAIGYLEIDAIDVTLPLYLGNSPAILQVGAGTMPGSSLPVGGPSTHAVITGHRGLPSSRLFTDLDQVAEGDVFVLHVLNETLFYQVDQIRIVEPQDLSELDIQEGKDFCTLITCTPYGINTHRMLVRGHRIEDSQMDAVDYRVTADAIEVDTLLVAPILALPLLVILVVCLFLRDKKKPRKSKKTKGRREQ